ncbi:pantothenate transporter liz1 [Aspergillus steynii IBT 23096]|uniref:Pantothenate transporter liz1 n=1 Tax=Aspergillus steynii IBT 23096 TaxID=1392250 RepID=A0A2I2GRI9_9EURO|nr:pantothenate transporter liz1 [Aspergillus steynii IBT 23096]PLB55492.1 pantothenate transporter liz1 [Aspergillus steynii IBT 23096]
MLSTPCPGTPKPSVELDEDVAKRKMSTAVEMPGVELNPATERKLVRKIDLFLLPAIWIVYLLSYMDRSNLGNARVAGMGDDLHITEDRYFLAVVLFQVGYVVAEVPCNMILARSRPSLFIPAIMICWGAVCAAVGSVKTWQQLVAARFILGVAEAGFSPAIMFIISSWYRRHEQSKRYLAFHSAGIVSGAFGSIVAGAITDGLEGARGMAGWRWLFIIEGVVTVTVAFVIPFILLDYPLTSKKLQPHERQLAYSRLRADGITSRNDATEHRIGHMKAFWISVSTWRLWILSVGYMTIIGCMSLAYFYPGFVERLGYDESQAQYMTAPLYAVALSIAIPLCILADRVPRYQALFVTSVLLVFGTLMCVLSAAVHGATARYVFLCFVNTAVWAGNPLSLSYISMVLGPVQPEVRAISFAIINGCANLAQLYGTYIFTVAKPPGYTMGFAVYSGIMAFGAVTFLSSFYLFRRWPYKAIEVF